MRGEAKLNRTLGFRAPRPLLTGAVHLSHFEYKTLKVLRSSKYSLLTLRSREQKPKIFLTFLLFFGGGGGGGRQKMERKFLVLLRRFRLRNENFHYIICGYLALFISPSLRRDEALPLGVWW